MIATAHAGTPAAEDLRALSWVQDEVRRSLEAAHKALHRHLKEAESLRGSDVDRVDPAVLRGARTHLHQAAGALALVGLAAPAQFLRASEQAVQRLAERPASVTAQAVEAIERSSFALMDFIGRLTAGKAVSGVALFPQFRALLELAGADRVHPADLWEHDWRWRVIAREPGISALAVDPQSREAMERLILRLMRTPDRSTLRRMSDLCAALGAEAKGRRATLWRLAAGFFEAQAAGLLRFDVYVKRAAPRLLAQVRLGLSSGEVSDRLAHDLLFFCTRANRGEADPALPRLNAVLQAYGLESTLLPDYEAPALGRFDPAWVAQGRKRVASAREAWSSVAAGEAHRQHTLAETFTLMQESLEKLYPNGGELGLALVRAAQSVGSAGVPAGLAMEVATAVLYLEASLEDGDLDEPHLAERIRRLAQRVDSSRRGGEPQALEPWMEELYRRVSDNQTMGSVVQELRASLSEVEKQIDQYFRKPEQRDTLFPVPGQLSSMRGVLSVLGLESATQAILRMREDVDQLAHAGSGADDEVRTQHLFDRLADNLGALSFMIDMLAVQPALAKTLFRFEPASGYLRALMGQPAREPGFADSIPDTGPGDLGDRARSVGRDAMSPAISDEALLVELRSLSQQALLAEQRRLADTLNAAQAALQRTDDPELRRTMRAELAGRLQQLSQVPELPRPTQPASAQPAPAPAPALAAPAVAAQEPGPDVPTAARPGDEVEPTAAVPLAEAPSLPSGPEPQPLTVEAVAAAPTQRIRQPVRLPEPSPDDAEMLAVFLEEAGEVIGEARGAMSRLDDSQRDSAGDLGEMTAVRRAFHTLKGSSRMVGLLDFGDAAWAFEQLYNARLVHASAIEPALRGLTLQALDYLDDWVRAIGERWDRGHAKQPVIEAAEAMRLRGHALAIVSPGAVQQSETVARVPAAEIPAAVDPTALTASIAADLAQPQPPAPVVQVETSAPVAQPAAIEWPLSDLEKTQVLPRRPAEGPAGLALREEPLQELDLGERTMVLQASELPGVDIVLESAGPAVEPDATAPRPALPPIPVEPALAAPAQPGSVTAPAVPGVDEPPLRVAAELDGLPPTPVFEPIVEPQIEPLSDPQATPATWPVLGADASPDELGESMAAPLEEPVKVIGPLRIDIAMFNIYLNEADELSRRLCTTVAEWALEPAGPPGELAVVLAHSLAGNSGTVGFAELSTLARSLEHALMRANESARVNEGETALFNEAAEDIRRMLHQFAAGFLTHPHEGLVERLDLHQPPAAETRLLEEPSEAMPLYEDESVDLLADMPLADLATPVAQEAQEAQPVSESKQDVPAAAEGATLAEASEPAAAGVEAEATSPAAALTSAAVEAAPPADGRLAARAPMAMVTGLARHRLLDDDDFDQQDVVDDDLFPIFSDEAEELLPQLHARVRDWLSRPGDRPSAAACMRTLHTFKGGARLAGAMRLGEMAHRLETTVERLLARAELDERDVEPLVARVDAIDAGFHALREAVAAERALAAASAPIAPPSSEGDAATRELEPAAPSLAQVDDGTGIRWARLLEPESAEPRAVQDRASSPGVSLGAVRVRATLLDRLVNHAGEVSISRARLESDLGQIKSSLGDLGENLERLRRQLRDVEVQAESQIASRLEAAKAAHVEFDPLEMDRYTRVQELTRMMAESVNDVATVQRSLQRSVQSGEDQIAQQARLTRSLQDDLMRTRMVEFESLSDRLYRVVRQAAKETGKHVRLDIIGGTLEIDRGVLERMTAPFEHLLRNSITHGIESPELRQAQGKDPTGQIEIRLVPEGNEVAIEFGDDGAGLNLARIRERALVAGLLQTSETADNAVLAEFIFTPGFSTAERVTELAGRGVGMDVVRSEVLALGGRVQIDTQPGAGARFRMVLPLTTAVTQVVMLRCGELRVAVPSNLVEIVRRESSALLEAAYRSGSWSHAGEAVPFYWLGSLLGGEAAGPTGTRTVPLVIVRSAAQRVALHVDEVLGNLEVVVKNLGPQLARLPGLSGMTLLPTGAAVPIYNPVALAAWYGAAARRRVQQWLAQHVTSPLAAAERPVAPQAPLVLVVDDSLTVRRVTQRLLQREGYRVVTAKDGLDALERIAEERPRVVLSDIEMPRMDGFDFVRNLRADRELSRLPVIMITSRIAQKHRDYAMELGVRHYLGKPYGEEELLGLVAGLLQLEAAPA
jgi:chemosensory pili system protein ChpA (sensor histidine kinase/response regulator)